MQQNPRQNYDKYFGKNGIAALPIELYVPQIAVFLFLMTYIAYNFLCQSIHQKSRLEYPKNSGKSNYSVTCQTIFIKSKQTSMYVSSMLVFEQHFPQNVSKADIFQKQSNHVQEILKRKSIKNQKSKTFTKPILSSIYMEES